MITFLASIALLVLGYFTYGKIIEKFFGASSKIVTPAKRLADGVDYQEMKPWRLFVIQFLNIAGLGPIFGAILGAAYGPIAYIWIVFGCILMGASHDYFSGMMSIRQDGKGIPDMVGENLGNGVKKFMLFFTCIMLLAVGASFVTGPADLLASLTSSNKFIWLYVVFAYYILATLLPINKIIGKIYPFFGGLLIFMAVAIAAVMVVKGFNGDITLIELTPSNFRNFHSDPGNNIMVPMMFIVISCGALSGFHSTQSPLMARCMGNEKYGRPVFYGAMICEGIVAIIWATAAMAFLGGPEALNAAADGNYLAYMQSHPDAGAIAGLDMAQKITPAILVDAICTSWLGKVGAVIAILGVVVCPITSGDTAFRSMRLIIADALKYDQKPIRKRIFISLPIFALAYLVCTFDFSTIWKYVGIGNQMLATIVLWTAATYLTKQKKNHLIMSIPAGFMTFISISYFMIAPYKAGGLYLNSTLSYIIGIVAALSLFVLFIFRTRKK